MFEFDQYKEEITLLCQLFGIQRLEIFGPASTDDFHGESDIDCLIEFADNPGESFR